MNTPVTNTPAGNVLGRVEASLDVSRDNRVYIFPISFYINLIFGIKTCIYASKPLPHLLRQ